MQVLLRYLGLGLFFTNMSFAGTQAALTSEEMMSCQLFFGTPNPSPLDFAERGLASLQTSRNLSPSDRGNVLSAAEKILGAINAWAYEIPSDHGPETNVNIVGDDGKTKKAIEFRSNAYLNMQTHPDVIEAATEALQKYGTGSGASRLIGGTTFDALELEQKLAQFTGKEAVLVTATGFQANMVWPVLLGPGDIVLEDAASHRSNNDGLSLAENRLGKRLTHKRFKHNDIFELETLLKAAREQLDSDTSSTAHLKSIYISVEGIYSMDGDQAPLREMVALAKKYNAKLIVDDAHGYGVVGDQGRGTAQSLGLVDDVYLSIGTLSKSFGSMGGFVAGDRNIIQYLKFTASNYIFTSALTPANIAAASKAIDILVADTSESPVRRLQRVVDEAAFKLKEAGLPIPPREAIKGGIIPIYLRGRLDARSIPAKLRSMGVLAVLVEFPAVAKDDSRLRIGFMANHTSDDIDRLVTALKSVLY